MDFLRDFLKLIGRFEGIFLRLRKDLLQREDNDVLDRFQDRK